MRHVLKWVLLAALLLLLASIPLAKQFSNGSMEGSITDERGSIQGAIVQADNVKGGTALRAVSSASGHYSLEKIRPGRYSVWVLEMSHDPVCVQNFSIERGQSLHKDFHMNETDPETIRNCETYSGGGYGIHN